MLLDAVGGGGGTSWCKALSRRSNLSLSTWHLWPIDWPSCFSDSDSLAAIFVMNSLMVSHRTLHPKQTSNSFGGQTGHKNKPTTKIWNSRQPLKVTANDWTLLGERVPGIYTTWIWLEQVQFKRRLKALGVWKKPSRKKKKSFKCRGRGRPEWQFYLQSTSAQVTKIEKEERKKKEKETKLFQCHWNGIDHVEIELVPFSYSIRFFFFNTCSPPTRHVELKNQTFFFFFFLYRISWPVGSQLTSSSTPWTSIFN